MLLFKKKFLEPIRRGEKTQTIRLWKHRRLKAGQRSYIPHCGYIQVTAVDPIALEDLTDDDARLDGFENAAALHKELAELYAEQIAKGYGAFRVRFEVVEK